MLVNFEPNFLKTECVWEWGWGAYLGERYLIVDDLKVVLAKISTLSWTVLPNTSTSAWHKYSLF
jgi:hypothetical protein